MVLGLNLAVDDALTLPDAGCCRTISTRGLDLYRES